MRKRSLAVALILCAGVMAGCSEKKGPEDKTKEAPTPAQQSAPAPPEKKEAPAVPAVKDKVSGKKTAVPAPADKTAKKADIGADMELGATIFKSKCLPCHGADGKGTAMAPAFKANDWIKSASIKDIARVIREGRQGGAKKYTNFAAGMPAFKDMDEKAVNSLAGYIKSIN